MRVLGVVVLFAVVVALLLVFLNWYVAPTKPSEKKDLVLALAQILAGTALLSGLYFTWRTLQVNREGQITERFTRAIDQFGSEELEIRLGGIYALERIATDSERDHWPIMQVLTAYVRQHARWRPEEGQEREENAAVEKSEEALRGKAEPTEVPAPDPEIQAIMTVLRRRVRSHDHGEPEPLDLHETNLRGADLWKANLRGANLVEANLSGASLRRANLSGANLRGVNLREADLRVADLTRADLTPREVNLGEEDLLVEMLSGEVPTIGADLWKANLAAADLVEANLFEANLSGAILAGADLRGAILIAAENLAQSELEEAKGDETTQLPDRKRPAHWGANTDEQSEEH